MEASGRLGIGVQSGARARVGKVGDLATRAAAAGWMGIEDKGEQVTGSSRRAEGGHRYWYVEGRVTGRLRLGDWRNSAGRGGYFHKTMDFR